MILKMFSSSNLIHIKLLDLTHNKVSNVQQLCNMQHISGTNSTYRKYYVVNNRQISLLINIVYYYQIDITNTNSIFLAVHTIVNILYDTQQIVYKYLFGHIMQAYNGYYQCLSVVLSMYTGHCGNMLWMNVIYNIGLIIAILFSVLYVFVFIRFFMFNMLNLLTFVMCFCLLNWFANVRTCTLFFIDI